MRFSQPYAEFFELQFVDPAMVEQTRRDFITQLSGLLNQLGVATPRAAAIAHDLWARMSHPQRHYHTPVHVLSMLSCADRTGLDLTDADELAVWFHDAIYQPGAQHGQNEEQSAQLMQDLLIPAGADPAIVNEAVEAIRWTARHLQEQVPPQYHKVLDLDLWGLAADTRTFSRQSIAVRAEMPHLTDEQYSRQTTEFFRKLLQRPRIYRTPLFGRFERVAREQVQREITRLAAHPKGCNGRHNHAKAG